MALEDLTKKILADAQAQVELARVRVEDTVTRIAQDREREVSTLKTVHANETQQLLLRQATLETQRTEQEVRALIEGAQRELLNETFENTLTAVLALPDAEYVQFVEPELARLAHSKEAINAVYVPASRVQCTKDVCARVGLQAPVEAREDIKGGFVAVGEYSEYDARIEQRMVHVQRTHESPIARMLFGA